MKKEFSKKRVWGLAAIVVVLAAVLITLVGFGSKASVQEELPAVSASPTITLSTSPKGSTSPKPSAKASPSPKVEATPKAEVKASSTPAASQPEQNKASEVTAVKESPSSVPVVTSAPVVEAAETTAPTPTPKSKKKVWVVDVPASTQQVWVDEQGHWEDKPYLTSDWVYRCNGCGLTFPNTGDVDAHQWAAFDNGEDHGGYTMTSGPMYEATERVWVVDVEGHYEDVTTPEQGHWDYQ